MGTIYLNGENEFDDPVLRCDSCQALLQRTELHKFGACHKCGNKRMRNVQFLNEKDKDLLTDWGFFDFLERFEIVPNG